ncbi:MAG: dihydropteroate synthase [Candidatus Heimdallarchaeaceae archaeon]
MINGFLGNLQIGDNYPARIIGVVNLSEASFFRGSVASSQNELQISIEKMINDGANGIDIGAQSTRPIQIYGGKGRLNENQELETVKKAVKVSLDVLSSYNEIVLSVDTMKKSVAEYSLKAGVRVINDISGFKKEKEIAKCIAEYDASVVLMAAKSEPGDVYEINDILHELQKSLSIGVEAGIKKQNMLVDPGIGSWEARDYKHDYSIIKNLKKFRKLETPIYIGISRKTSIGKILDEAPPEERLYGSLGATIVAIVNGAHVIRTHDVRPTLEAVKVAETIINY